MVQPQFFISQARRLIFQGCLIVFIITDFSGFAWVSAYAQAENNMLPSDVYAPDQVTTERMAPPPPTVPKIKWWKRPFKKKEPPVDEETIINVGPREYPITPGPLLRLSQPLMVKTPNDGAKLQVLPPGFYLARYQKTANQSQMMYLYHGRKLLAQIPLFSIEKRAAEPVETLDEDAPPLESVQASLIEQGTKALITFTQGKKRYQSHPLPVQTDPRPQLRY